MKFKSNNRFYSPAEKFILIDLRKSFIFDLVAYLVKLLCFYSQMWLVLSNNPSINDDGGKMILGCLEKLEVLGLRGCSLSDEIRKKLKHRGVEVGCRVFVD